MSYCWIVYDKSTGTELWRMQTADQSPGAAFADEGSDKGALPVPQSVFNVAPTSMALVTAHLHQLIDSQAEVVRSQFVTPGSGQAISYLEKRLEAAAYVADPATADVTILSAEAAAVGKTLPELASEVLVMAGLWRQGEALVNATRMGAKKAVSDAAGNLALMHAASEIDWQTIMQPVIELLEGAGE